MLLQQILLSSQGVIAIKIFVEAITLMEAEQNTNRAKFVPCQTLYLNGTSIFMWESGSPNVHVFHSVSGKCNIKWSHTICHYSAYA